MAHKHQDQCYRTIKGERYINYCDVLGAEEQAFVAAAKAKKIAHRVVKHPSGFRILFVREADAHRLAQ